MKPLSLATLVALSVLSASMFSMQEAHAERGTIGFGTSIDLRLGNAVGLGNVLVPIHVSDTFVIEPEFGVLYTSQSNDDDNDPVTGETTESTESSLGLRLGAGVLYKNAINKKVNIYGGLRLGISYNSNSEENGSITQDRTRTDFWVGGVSGGEYFISSAFSIGGEWGLYMTSIGTTTVDTTVDGNSMSDEVGEGQSNQTISTTTMVTVRWYFM